MHRLTPASLDRRRFMKSGGAALLAPWAICPSSSGSASVRKSYSALLAGITKVGTMAFLTMPSATLPKIRAATTLWP